jgi:transketolase
MTNKEFAKQIRLKTLKMVFNSGSSHIGSAFSYADILAVLYNKILNVNPSIPNFPERDRLILSKGHACSSLYAALAIKGFFPITDLETYGKNGSDMMNHVSHKVKGVEFSTGSLGHGLPFAVGKALALKLRKLNSKVYVILGDGELAEGSNFEAMLFAAHHKLDNLIMIIDHNNLQSLTTVDKTLNLKPYKEKIKSFNWNYFEIDGNNLDEIENTLVILNSNNKPTAILANTVKGKGVDFMENQVKWHYKSPNHDEYVDALNQIKNA